MCKNKKNGRKIMIEMKMKGNILLIKINEYPLNKEKIHLDFTINGELNGIDEKPIHATIFKRNNDIFIESNVLTIIVDE